MNTHIAIWRLAILLMALAPLGYYVIAILAAVRFFQRESPKTLPAFTPPVSLLKPVRGVDFASYENFASFCVQNYPDYEILFCVNEMTDVAVPVIEQVMKDFPKCRLRILSNAPQVGSNRKVNNLALLTHEAEYEILLQTDGDVRVGPNYVREMVAPFADPSVGVTSCFYRAVAQNSFWAELEAVGTASDFFAGALVAEWKEGITFALGASVATTRSWLGKIGGYEALADLLADDYELGNRIHKAGGKVLLCREPVWTMYPAQGAKGFWDHQVRWSRTVRLCRPASFFGLLFTHGLPWSLLASLVAPTVSIVVAYLLAYLVLRFAMAWVVGIWGVGDEVLRRRLWLVHVRDLLNFGVWLAGFTSSRVTWGGLEYVMKDGRMIEVSAAKK
jgi:ceramide glucosyltransferase